MRIDCESDHYDGVLILSLCMAVGFVFGLPCYWLVNLMRYREEIQREGPYNDNNIMLLPSPCRTVLLLPSPGSSQIPMMQYSLKRM